MVDTTDNRLVALVLVLVGAVFVLPMVGMGLLGYGHMGGGMWGSGGMWGGSGTLPVWILVVGALVRMAFLVLVALGAYLLYRAVSDDSESGDPALAELRQAYARGDLSDEEFERRREKLDRHR